MNNCLVVSLALRLVPHSSPAARRLRCRDDFPLQQPGLLHCLWSHFLLPFRHFPALHALLSRR